MFCMPKEPINATKSSSLEEERYDFTWVNVYLKRDSSKVIRFLKITVIFPFQLSFNTLAFNPFKSTNECFLSYCFAKFILGNTVIELKSHVKRIEEKNIVSNNENSIKCLLSDLSTIIIVNPTLNVPYSNWIINI